VTFTGEPLTEPLEAIGPVRVELHARASSPNFDLFARVCDVDAAGASWNVCDALLRVAGEPSGNGPPQPVTASFELWPIAHRFGAGHRIRLQVSSGAHPRYARNPGTGENAVSATALRAVEVELLHDPAHPSVLLLPASGGFALPSARDAR